MSWRTSRRLTLIRRAGSSALPARKRFKVSQPIKMGQAQASRTRTLRRGRALV